MNVIVRYCRFALVGVLLTFASSPPRLLGAEPNDASKKRVTDLLAAYKANVVASGSHFVDVTGWTTTASLGKEADVREAAFRFVGVFDQDRKRVRWVCRNHGLLADDPTARGVETEIYMTPSLSCVWSNGLPHSNRDDKEEQQAHVRSAHGTPRFHPLSVVLGGWGVINDPAYRGRDIRVATMDQKAISDINLLVDGVRATWTGEPGRWGVFETSYKFAKSSGGMPVFAKCEQRIGDKKMKIYEMDAKWKKVDDAWLPIEVAFARYRGEQVVEHRFTCKWVLDDAATIAAFKLVEEDLSRPAWTPKLEELLGEHNRISALDAELVLAPR